MALLVKPIGVGSFPLWLVTFNACFHNRFTYLMHAPHLSSQYHRGYKMTLEVGHI